MSDLFEFMTESLRIDMMLRAPLAPEMEAVENFLALKAKLSPHDIEDLAQVFNHSARLRSTRGLYAQGLGPGTPQAASGKRLVDALGDLLEQMVSAGPYVTHLRFAALMPLTYANGVVGRALWLKGWLGAGRPMPRSFFRSWYDDTVAIGQTKPLPRKRASSAG